MTADIFVYAIVAAGLVFWLRSILGTRHEDERPHGNPYLAKPENRSGQAAAGQGPAAQAPASPEQKIMELAQNPRGVFAIENKTAENALLDIARMDKDFDVLFFLNAAQDAFAIIVEAFAEGDRDTLEDLLEARVYKAFDAALKERAEKGEVQETEIHAITKAEITGARLVEKTAYITVRFEADETSVTRDRDGNVIAGNPDRTVKMSDIWVFGRKLRSKDPRWLLHETRGDFEDDNDLIPDTD